MDDSHEIRRLIGVLRDRSILVAAANGGNERANEEQRGPAHVASTRLSAAGIRLKLRLSS
jgi:hypothetical protein